MSHKSGLQSAPGCLQIHAGHSHMAFRGKTKIRRWTVVWFYIHFWFSTKSSIILHQHFFHDVKIMPLLSCVVVVWAPEKHQHQPALVSWCPVIFARCVFIIPAKMLTHVSQRPAATTWTRSGKTFLHTHTPTLMPFPDWPLCQTRSPHTPVKRTSSLWLGHSLLTHALIFYTIPFSYRC